MNVVDSTKDHLEWAASTAAALVVTYVARKRGAGQAIKGALTESRIGRLIDAEGRNAGLQATVNRQAKEIADLEASFGRQAAAWDRERLALTRDAERLLVRVERLSNLGEGIKAARDAGALVPASEPPSNGQTSSPPTSSASSKRSKTPPANR